MHAHGSLQNSYDHMSYDDVFIHFVSGTDLHDGTGEEPIEE